MKAIPRQWLCAPLREHASEQAGPADRITTCGWLLPRDQVTDVITRRPAQRLTE